ncbi:MAG: hypothetical protein KGJ37_02055 [Verrucomicrobiota bacterium]|nr:hypothetical protein [Verrucomicrobiota bacterium]
MILVTGCAGFIGFHRRLLAESHAVGFSPATPIEDGVRRRFVEWYRSYYGA